ncbi:NAD-dependent epimerase/dehydratase family protein [Pleomorphomonas sp. PLEO]|uniref:NAD-dependent epimerase/dehydratase family protein n=1 Tax=Pleomorphomonas sp. PLEO TaxID=3239306 RepID=UPI00351EC080
MPISSERKIVITGGAGLVGQNLIQRLEARGIGHIVAIDKHPANTAILAKLHPGVEVIEADMAHAGAWQDAFAGADTVVLNHAQIGGVDERPFTSNNITASEHAVAAALRHAVANVVHISSSVVNSQARDFYTESKKAQEKLVVASGLPVCVLRPTLMFGWFDRKHLGWLARFIQRSPIFPVPGSGRYLRQPLYVGDLCEIIISCIETPRPGQAFNISGQEKIDYIDLIRAVKTAIRASTPIVRIPYSLFWLLLKTYALVDRDPPFTTQQLKALVTPDVFEVIDWPGIFGVKATPLADALHQTFQDPTYSDIVLEF